jgi:pimeloyl-ACP methyl ester carboxylesterase
MYQLNFKEKKVAFYLSGGGDKTPIVLLHGFCEDSSLWEEWLSLLPPRSVIRIDLPGFGQSELQDVLTIEQMADTVIAVLDHLQVKKCHLVGHSMGGYVCMAFAEKQAQRLTSLCMFHSHPFADPEDRKAGRLKSIESVKKNGPIVFVRQLIPRLFAYDYSKGYPIEVHKLIHRAIHFSPEAIIAALEAMRIRPDRSKVLKNITCPVLFFIGKHDTAVPLNMSLAQAHLPTLADIHLLPTAGHMGMFEAQRETAKAFREFLGRLEG